MKVWITDYHEGVYGDPQAFSTPEKAFEYLKWFIRECSSNKNLITIAQEEFNSDKSVFGVKDFLHMVEVEIDNF